MSAKANWCLYLDDERDPKTAHDWTVVRSYAAAVAVCLNRGCPSMVSFDHDLGDEAPTGLSFARWLVNRDMDTPGFIPSDFSYNVHSANPVGAANISGLLDGYLRERAA